MLLNMITLSPHGSAPEGMASAAGMVPAPAWRAVRGELRQHLEYRGRQARPSALHAGTACAGAGRWRPRSVFDGAASHTTEGTMTSETITSDVVQVIEARTPWRRKRGDGGLYRRPGTAYWWMRIPYRSGMLRESTGETDRKKAKVKLDAKRDEIAAARGGYTTLVGPEQKSKTVDALLDALVQDFELRKVRSLKSIKSYIKSVEKAFGHWKAVELVGAEDAITRYIAGRVKAGHAPASINHSLQVLLQAIRPFLTKHRLPVPEIRRLPEDNVREGFYSRADVEKLIPALPEDLRDFTRWGFLCGWRKAEIASLRWADVDREAGSLRLSWRKSKSKQARTMALVGDLAAIIERRAAAR